MSLQLESRHFFRRGDTVEHRTGALGTVIESRALYAVLEWRDGRREEVDQFDPRIVAIARAESSG